MYSKPHPFEAAEARPEETALVTLGRLDIADVPDMGYEPWRKAKRERDECLGTRSGMLALTPFSGGIAAGLLYLLLSIPSGGAPIFIHVMTWIVAAFCLMPVVAAAHAHRQLAKLPDPLGFLPPGSSPELAQREHELVTRIEAHNRNVRLLRGMPVIDPEALEKAEDEERDLRGGTLALGEAKSDIAGLLTDGA